MESEKLLKLVFGQPGGRGFGMLQDRKDLMAHMERMIMGKPQSFGGFINRNKRQRVGENFFPDILVSP